MAQGIGGAGPIEEDQCVMLEHCLLRRGTGHAGPPCLSPAPRMLVGRVLRATRENAGTRSSGWFSRAQDAGTATPGIRRGCARQWPEAGERSTWQRSLASSGQRSPRPVAGTPTSGGLSCVPEATFQPPVRASGASLRQQPRGLRAVPADVPATEDTPPFSTDHPERPGSAGQPAIRAVQGFSSSLLRHAWRCTNRSTASSGWHQTRPAHGRWRSGHRRHPTPRWATRRCRRGGRGRYPRNCHRPWCRP